MFPRAFLWVFTFFQRGKLSRDAFDGAEVVVTVVFRARVAVGLLMVICGRL